MKKKLNDKWQGDAIKPKHIHAAAKVWDVSPGISGFRASRKYDVVVNGKRYPPKAICGIAYQEATGQPLLPNDFVGADDGYWHRRLKKCGFEILRKAGSLRNDLDEILETDESPSEKMALIMSRLGQGLFRGKLDKRWKNACAVVGTECREILRASHIKSWADCIGKQERLDVDNGLLLSANLDCLFEAGLISFNPAGRILISKKLPQKVQLQIPVKSDMALRFAMTTGQAKFMKWHSKYRFRP